MKKPYQPIDLPVCLCGRRPAIANRVRNNESLYHMTSFEPVTVNGQTVGYTLDLVRRPMWLCGCECGQVGAGSTKRAAVDAFRKGVEISVDARK